MVVSCCHFGLLLIGDLFHLVVWVSGARPKPVCVVVEYYVLFVATFGHYVLFGDLSHLWSFVLFGLGFFENS